MKKSRKDRVRGGEGDQRLYYGKILQDTVKGMATGEVTEGESKKKKQRETTGRRRKSNGNRSRGVSVGGTGGWKPIRRKMLARNPIPLDFHSQSWH